ncbi:MAG: hypothetical protein WC656_09570 [Sulfurimonas sp.]|jgi:hypothetical protein
MGWTIKVTVNCLKSLVYHVMKRYTFKRNFIFSSNPHANAQEKKEIDFAALAQSN